MTEIQKAKLVAGNRLEFRDAQIDDAEFILQLRTDTRKSRYLSKISGDLESQRKWLENYRRSDDQAYFIIMSAGMPCGTVRMYDAFENSFCWGSWLMAPDCPSSFAIESALIIYSYALELGFSKSHFDVRRGNESVWKFHERFGATRVRETDLDFFYEIDSSALTASLQRYKKFLPNGVEIKR